MQQGNLQLVNTVQAPLWWLGVHCMLNWYVQKQMAYQADCAKLHISTLLIRKDLAGQMWNISSTTTNLFKVEWSCETQCAFLSPSLLLYAPLFILVFSSDWWPSRRSLSCWTIGRILSLQMDLYLLNVFSELSSLPVTWEGVQRHASTSRRTALLEPFLKLHWPPKKNELDN